ncbi:1,4-alpha-glucan branching protein GlgB [Verticiella sediminum]|uniref:1,4-alpha-glucan branching enzyme GlgB n=1 Tax=Verticiella sediminum TaxID=1247510 RepID=A0A556AS81_9BURK|nr:1,4-alpha-glucan branching protein GlgB [Verticiella sediminum]TSH95793.1 1,4-alpha-glucan branching protein GlgB [Verticiella sediminum]
MANAPDIDPSAIDALLQGRHGDPYAVLGPHGVGDARELRVLAPGARGVLALREDGSSERLRSEREGFFRGRIGAGRYRLRIEWDGAIQETEDPYAFGTLLEEDDLHAIAAGRHPQLTRVLGAHAMRLGEVDGVRFAVWAPNARRVSVVGDFNAWDGRRHPMRARPSAGVWEIFVPGIGPGARYKYEIIGPDGHIGPQKADPLARRTEAPPATASIVAGYETYAYTDGDWMRERAARHAPDAPIAVYEMHAGSWRHPAGGTPSWHYLSEQLIPYVQAMGFTHIELMPIMEHPFGGSWGYQPLGLFAPTARYGPPEAFAEFVDRCHAAGIGVILDWVPAHFPSDAHGLVRFDGTALYEHQDPREGYHPDWNTMIYNLGRNEVRNLLIASALEWLERYHVDGLRVDAVASMLYRDYSRKADEWVPNVFGGRENLESIAFLRELNGIVRERCPGALMIAEESTAWPGVSAPVDQGGLGFHYKWNMGWMHDTLHYMHEDPLHRRYHHHEMTFGLVYAWSERFMLPLSHDEVVHGKGSLLGKMPGDEWQRLANLRAYYAFMWTHPGKKLLFMGCEIGQHAEWNHDGEVSWWELDAPGHRGLQRLVRDLNHLYAGLPALHRLDAEPDGFAWVIGDDAGNSVYAYRRRDGRGGEALVVCNMTPVPREGYRIGVPAAGAWRERLNTDAQDYGGSGMGNAGGRTSEPVPSHGMPDSLCLTLPPLATLILQYEG